MNIVVVDAAHLAGEADFPELDVPKYGWQQFPALAPAELAERCWRSDAIVAIDTPIDRQVITKAFKLALIVAAGDDYSHIDRAAAAERGITVCHIPGADPADAAQAAHICTQVVATIAAYLRGAPINVAGA
jgi:lactate dehydrogenase-like 2-hydroxyacid dehydrogenase